VALGVNWREPGRDWRDPGGGLPGLKTSISTSVSRRPSAERLLTHADLLLGTCTRAQGRIAIMTFTRTTLALAALLSGSSLALGCASGQDQPSEGTAAQPFQLCVLDGAFCIDADIPDIALPPWLDAGIPQLPDVGIPSLPDVGIPLPDVSIPSFPDGGGFGFDAGAGNCDPTNPTYATEYVAAIQSGNVAPCGACAANECCFVQLACVLR
jgi:hypothetical protein